MACTVTMTAGKHIFEQIFDMFNAHKGSIFIEIYVLCPALSCNKRAFVFSLLSDTFDKDSH